MVKDGPTTRKKLLHEAEKLFAAKGFYGTSLGAVASKVGISKPSLLHHFPSKEKLYAAVLEGIAAEMLRTLRKDLSAADEYQQLLLFSMDLCHWSERNRLHAQILMRELLDNPARIKQVRTWYLAPLIGQLVAMVESGQRKGLFRPVDPLVFVYTLLGTQHYYAISEPTLKKMLAPRDYRQIAGGRAAEMKRLIGDLLLEKR